MAELTAKRKYEQGLIKTIKEMLKNPDVNIKYEHDGGNDPYFTYTVSQEKTEIFYLKYAIPGKADKSTLRIKGKTQDWDPESLKELDLVVSKAWWDREGAKDAKKQQAKEDKVKQEQAEISSFLAGFLPGKGERN